MGFIYGFKNNEMNSGIIKIGMTERHPYERLKNSRFSSKRYSFNT